MKLYNTLTRQIEELETIKSGEVSMYTCGLTVYSRPHIGNWVAYIYWDILQRTLSKDGYKINRVQNITDVGHLTSDEDAGEDKMLASALKEGKTAWEVADKYIEIANHEGYEMLGLLKPEHLPRATDYIDQQIAFVESLEKSGYTYQAEDGIYFDTDRLNDYGKLAKLDVKGLKFGARVENTGKKNPTDFALWKFSPKDQKRDMEWDSPWGIGFPGWHLECSVLAREFLGDQIDIHTGGVDHIPVHHTNEIAQTESLTNKKPFAKVWLHANHIKVDGTKMSKSLGNVYTLQDIIDRGYTLEAFKLLVLDKHYRTEGNFTWEILEHSSNRLQAMSAVANLKYQTKASDKVEVIEAMRGALGDDLDTHQALYQLSRHFDELMQSLQAPNDKVLDFVQDFFGITLLQSDITVEQKNIITELDEARKSKKYQKADELRKTLLEQGIELMLDTKYGTIWSRKLR